MTKFFLNFFFINSIVAPMCVLFICVTIMTVFSTSRPIPNPLPAVWGTEAVMTLFSMVVTFVIWFLVKNKQVKFFIDQRRKDPAHNLKLIFFWLFGIMYIFNSAMNLGINVECVLDDRPETFPFAYYISILCHISGIFYCVGQLGFLSFYGKYSFKCSPLINLGISLMIIAHILTWFRLLLDSITDVNSESWNATVTSQQDCFLTSNISSIGRSIRPYTRPFITEYSLLSTAIVLRMLGISDSDSMIRSSEGIGRTSRVSSYEQSIESSENSSTETRSISYFAPIATGLILSLPFLLGFFVFAYLQTPNTAMIFRIISIVYECEVLVLISLGSWRFRSEFCEEIEKRSTAPNNEIVLIFVTAGAVAYEVFGCIAGLMLTKSDLGLLLFLNKILQIIVIVIQTIFILYTNRTTFKLRSGRKGLLKAYSIFLCIFFMNISRWFVDSLVAGKKTQAIIIQEQFYKEAYWKTIEYTVFPVNVFYRFIIAIEMFVLYRKTVTCY